MLLCCLLCALFFPRQLLGVKFEGVNYGGPYDPASVYGYPVKWGKSTNMEAVTHTLLGPLMKRSSVGTFKTLDAFDFRSLARLVSCVKAASCG